MPPPSLIRRPAGVGLALLLLAGCGSKNSYDAAEDSLRDWLTALEAGNYAQACESVTSRYSAELVAGDAGGAGGSACEDAMARLTDAHVPPADAPMMVAVWDPSGEARVEVTDPADGRVSSFDLQHSNGEWLVAGEVG